MVPASYHSFFSGSCSVAGALIGLLFVAISIAPQKLRGEEAVFGFQARAIVAFSALVNAMVIALFGLIPGGSLGICTIALGVGSASSSAGLVLLALRERSGPGQAKRGLFLLVLILGVYLYEVVNGVFLEVQPHDLGWVTTDATLVIVFFIVAIARAWELLGGAQSGFFNVVWSTFRAKRPAAPPGLGGAASETPPGEPPLSPAP